jgi:hypothetical protein
MKRKFLRLEIFLLQLEFFSVLISQDQHDNK